MEEDDEEMLESCPNCGAIWGCEEMDFQECDCCGYPLNSSHDDLFYDDDELVYEQIS